MISIGIHSIHRSQMSHRFIYAALGLLVVMSVGLGASQVWGAIRGESVQDDEATDDNQSVRVGYRVRVPLPVTGAVKSSLIQQIQLISEKAPQEVKAARRPVLILEFDTRNATGQGSELGACLDIAVLLTDTKLKGLHTVAYVPDAPFSEPGNDQGATSQLKGHAVLLALACNEFALHEHAAIGDAGIDDADGVNSELAIGNYRNIVGRRLTIPKSIAQAMVDKNFSLFQVETASGTKFVDQEELEQLDRSGEAIKSSTLSRPGSLLMLDSATLQRYRLIRHRVTSRRDLAMRLNIDPATIEGDPAADGDWQAVQLSLGPVIDAESVEWTLRLLKTHFASHPTNLIIIRLNADGGDLQACLRLARELAAYDSEKVRTVAFVEQGARGPSALVAMACDQLVMCPAAQLGGPGIVPLSEEELSDLKPLIQKLAAEKDRDWSLIHALVDPAAIVSRWRHKRTGQLRFLSTEEHAALADRDEWLVIAEFDVAEGVNGKDAQTNFLSQATLDSFEQLKVYYQLAETPPELKPSAAQKWIESVMQKLASPGVAFMLLFGAIFFLSTESSSPGLGVPGFLGSICLLLFFWSQYLDGNAEWFEIMLFFVGVIFVVLEIFVIPGIGIFGIGGFLMIVISIILASQSFIIPYTPEEFARLPVSLSMVLAAGGGFLAAVLVIRRFLPTMPMFRRLMLPPPSEDTSISPTQRSKRESMVDRSHLEGRTGKTKTPLVPSGKAQIGSELIDVISDGRMIEPDTHVKVVEVTGNRVLVQIVET